MGSKRTRSRQTRRARRKAKLSGWKRQPKGRKVGHGTSLSDTLGTTPGRSATRRTKKSDRREVASSGPDPDPPMAGLMGGSDADQ